MWRVLICAGLLVSCVAPQVRHDCPGPCAAGQVCDHSVGFCKDDPCHGKCTGSLRCKAGPPPKCVEIGVGEAKISVPGEPTGPAEPPPNAASVPGPATVP